MTKLNFTGYQCDSTFGQFCFIKITFKQKQNVYATRAWFGVGKNVWLRFIAICLGYH